MKVRSLCESPGALSPADNGAYDNNDDDTRSYFSSTEMYKPPENLKLPLHNFSHVASPYNPDDVGLIPVAKNKADSKTETVKQTGGMWDSLGKINDAMLGFFPGTSKYVFTMGQPPTTFVTPEVNPGSKLPSKTGGAGVVIPPSEAISPSIKQDDEYKGFWAEKDELGFWQAYFNAYKHAGDKSTAEGGIDFINKKGIEPTKDAILDAFTPPGLTPGSKSGIDTALSLITGKDQKTEGEFNWLFIGAIGVAFILFIAIIK